MSLSPQTALLVGATGQVGQNVLKELLASSQFSQVVEVGRRVTPAEQLEGAVGKEKLVQKVIDFDEVHEAGLKDIKADIVVITLGTYQKLVKNDAEFVKIDHDYAVESAKAAKIDGASQRLVYLSSAYADPDSFILYTKSKGRTECDLAKLGYSDFIVFQPGVLLGTKRDYFHGGEGIFGGIIGWIKPLTPGCGIDIKTLGKSITLAAAVGSQGLPAAAQAKPSSFPGVPPYQIILNRGATNMAS